MATISQETFEKFTEEEKKKLRDEYNSSYRTPNDRYILECTFGKENLQPKPEIKTWDDVKKVYPNTYGNENIELFPCNEFVWDAKLIRKNIAMLKIAKLIELGYGGIVTEEEWENEDIRKFSIVRFKKKLSYAHGFAAYEFVSFHTPEQREKFLSYPENKKLVEQYYMI
ncbi:MAG: hypothetical protein J1F35_08550 [Erysipelotrichales bacterium]|nr:hypothetical protein [Erysipelotrichales bacterium]